MHMVAARLGFEKAMVGTRWATPRPDCVDMLRKHYSQPIVLTITCSLMSGCGQSHETAY